MTTNVNAVLAERAKIHGSFTTHAQITQDLKNVIRMHLVTQRKVFPAHHMEALDMICHKIARVVNGDLNHLDHWVDIAGYAQCAENSIVELAAREEAELQAMTAQVAATTAQKKVTKRVPAKRRGK